MEKTPPILARPPSRELGDGDLAAQGWLVAESGNVKIGRQVQVGQAGGKAAQVSGLVFQVRPGRARQFSRDLFATERLSGHVEHGIQTGYGELVESLVGGEAGADIAIHFKRGLGGGYPEPDFQRELGAQSNVAGVDGEILQRDRLAGTLVGVVHLGIADLNVFNLIH